MKRYRYDATYDTLSYRLDRGRYAKSIEFGDIVLDIGEDGTVVGIRIFEASQLFGLEREHLVRVRDFRFSVERSSGVVSLNVSFVPLADGEPLLRQRLIRELPSVPIPF